MNNPLLQDFKTPFGAPPFSMIKLEDYTPAIREAIKLHNKEIENIINNPDTPDFENTIVAFEQSGELLSRVTRIFDNLNSSMTGEEMRKIAENLSPERTAHMDAIRMNEKLFLKIKAVYEKRAALQLGKEDSTLLEETYIKFVRGGANLSQDGKKRLSEINEELALLSLKYGQNVLKDINRFKLVIEKENDLAGLPESVKAGASETAAESGLPGKWVFTVQKPSMIPFLTYSEKRELRENLFKAYINLGNNNDSSDNKAVISRIVKLRIERAKLLGYPSHAAFVLERNMAGTPEKVMSFLDDLWARSIPVAKNEAIELQALIDKEGGDFKLEPWDWWFYAEKLRKVKYELDEEDLRPYFELEKVRDGAFDVANKLWGIKFEKRTDIPIFQEDVQVFEVKDSDGSHLGILYMDFFPRASKRAGAWMNEFRSQEVRNGVDIRPIVSTTFNFSKPTGNDPALLTLEEVETLFHEFGHALQGLLSRCRYSSLSGTSVRRDFVELCSQIMENWATEPEVLTSFAKNFKTGEPIPSTLVNKIEESQYFNQGFATVEYLAASLLDMHYHILTDTLGIDLPDFETRVLNEAGLIPQIVVRYRSTYFNHIFSGGYSAGYYAYIWAEVLDSDAFEAFKETGNIFDRETALAFRKNIMEKGGTEDPMILYTRFRGKEPSNKPLLRKRGLI